MTAFLGDRLGPWFERALDLSSRRHEYLAANVANIDTPFYVPKDLPFEAALKSELTDSRTGGALTLVQNRPDGPLRLDGNRVDLDLELTRLAANRTFHELATEVVSRRAAMMRYAIDEGGR